MIESKWQMVVANQLFYWRNMRGLSQTELAKLTGLKASAISHFECRRRVPSLYNFYKICAALNVKAEKIFKD